MKYERFEDLPVWKAAIEFAVKVYELTAREQCKEHGGLRDQLERAAVSISNNIAEGFERGTTQELLTFIYIARGSCGEARSELCLLELLPPFRDLKSEISNLKSRSEREEFLEELRRMQEERIAKLQELRPDLTVKQQST